MIPGLVLGTANGALPVKEAVSIQVGPLGEVIHAYSLADTPHVLTLGRRCRELGYSFWWPPYADSPQFWLPEYRRGHKVDIETIDNVPYVVEYELAPNEPTLAAAVTASSDLAPEDISPWPSESDSGQPESDTADGDEDPSSPACTGFLHSLTHFPKDPNCDVCIKAACQRRRKIKGGLAMGDASSGRCKKFAG